MGTVVTMLLRFVHSKIISEGDYSSKMEKLTLISGALFLTADIFAIISLAMPYWIVTEVGGETSLGLMWTCTTLYNRPKICYSPDLPPEWMLSLICIFIGCVCITTTVVLLISSHWDYNVVPYARWVGFAAMVLFCLAAVIFPLGFSIQKLVGSRTSCRTVIRSGYRTFFCPGT